MTLYFSFAASTLLLFCPLFQFSFHTSFRVFTEAIKKRKERHLDKSVPGPNGKEKKRVFDFETRKKREKKTKRRFISFRHLVSSGL